VTAVHAEPPRTEPSSYAGLRVGVVGLGVEGQDAVQFLRAEGASTIVVFDRRSAAEFADLHAALNEVDFELRPDSPRALDAADFDALIVSQGVLDAHPLVAAAHAGGLPISATARLFLQRCPAPVIGITGSAGKTTTTTLVHRLLQAAGRRVVVGGNIGSGILAQLDTIDRDTAVVLEISHTQLLRTDRSPHLAAVLNITPNHLDQFDWAAYVDLKRNLVQHQTPDDIVVLPTDNAEAAALASDTPARRYWFGTAPGEHGAFVEDDRIIWRDDGVQQDVAPLGAIQLRGPHNVQNVLAAVAIVGAWGAPLESAATAIANFRGVPQRLEEIATIDGVLYVNDSIATTPERTLAALRSFDAPIVLLLGGREKQLPLDELAAAARKRARAVVGFGEAGAAFLAPLGTSADVPALRNVPALPEAVSSAHELAQPGDVVLLSPAGTSFDAYVDFADRGRHFVELVQALARERIERGGDGAS
jgi:UDP-N-acetylmuramoylalanine--D-glutamate ligase